MAHVTLEEEVTRTYVLCMNEVEAATVLGIVGTALVSTAVPEVRKAKTSVTVALARTVETRLLDHRAHVAQYAQVAAK
ncbi:hypothetical protein LCGC14_2094940 [marine sediment metagenome]|uniref:Uncharacterized protein n=1 Tax=marine sediment metagenome TaxID=412755 RepID=A0A0F9EBW3_9ZZZZ